MTVGGKIILVLILIALSIFGVIGCYGGIYFITKSTTLAGMECIRHLVGGFLMALISVAMLWFMGIAAWLTITE
jgi:hypothetical protein